MSHESAFRAVQLGLMRFARPDQPFFGRTGQPRQYVIDSRGAGTNLALRTFIVEQFSERLRDLPQIEVVVGVAKSGIAWGAWLAWDAALPFATVLPDGPREAGLQRAVEGEVAGKRAVLIDNWVRSGDSLNKATRWIEAAGGAVAGTLAIARHPSSPPIPELRALWTLEELLDASQKLGLSPEPADARRERH
jgi:orotate phosphoribosyltransferase